MKKISIYLFMLLSIKLSAQTNPWIGCDPLKTINRINDVIDPSMGSGESAYGRFGFTGSSSIFIGNNVDTCFIIKAPDTCGVGANCNLLCCISNGSASYTILCDEYIENSYSRLPDDFTLFADGVGPTRNAYKMGDTVLRWRLMSGDTTEGGARIYCNTCIESIITDYIMEKLYGSSDNVPCIVLCDTLKVSPPLSVDPRSGLPNVTVTASGAGNGILTYSWSFAGSPLLGSGTSCPPIDMGSLPSGGGTICVTITNTLPNGTSCSCVSCVGICMNVISPNKASMTMLNNWEIYPMPISDIFNINAYTELSEDEANIDIIDLAGKNILKLKRTIKKGNSTIAIDTKDLPKGNYILHLNTSNKSMSKRILLK